MSTKAIRALGIVILSAAAFISLLVFTSIRSTLAEPTNGIYFDRDSATIYLKPSFWVGQPFPILSEIDIGPKLVNGNWNLVLYHRDCLACQEAIASLSSLTNGDTPVRWAFVEVPPTLPAVPDLIPQNLNHITGSFSGPYRWIVQTPVFMKIKAGRIYSVKNKWSSED